MLGPSKCFCPSPPLLLNLIHHERVFQTPCNPVTLALSLCFPLAIDMLLSQQYLFSSHRILPILKNPRLLPPWNHCWLLHLPLPSLFTEQEQCFKSFPHNLAMNYIVLLTTEMPCIPYLFNLRYGNQSHVGSFEDEKIFHEIKGN